MVDIYNDYYKGKNVLITGGLGFIGSNLAHALAKLEHGPSNIIIVDSLIQNLGADSVNPNDFNIAGLENKADVYKGPEWDLRNTSNIEKLIRNNGCDCIFNLAGSVAHNLSDEDPEWDRSINYDSHISLIKACKNALLKGELKIVFAGTRDQYGKNIPKENLPVRESQVIIEASDTQGIHKYAAELFHLKHNGLQNGSGLTLKTVSLRLTNIYGPRQQMIDPDRGFVPWFIRTAIDNGEIKLWGGGRSLRDLLFVDDAVEAFLAAMSSENTNGNAYNVSNYIRFVAKPEDRCGNVVYVGDVAKMITLLAGSGSCVEVDYPEDKKIKEIGHYCGDATKLYDSVAWHPKTSLEEGLLKTIEFYMKNKPHYW